MGAARCGPRNRFRSPPSGRNGPGGARQADGTLTAAVACKNEPAKMNAPQPTAVADPAPAMLQRACPACARTTRHRLRFRVNGCDVLQCEGCGLGRTQTVQFDPAAYYTGEYFSG